MQDVAIIGAGPAGLVAAKYLRQHGFTPILFEQGASVGGQWCAGAPYSGVWPGLRTNTSRIMSAFSDLAHAPGVAVFPTHAEMHAYLERYAATFGLTGALRLGTRVTDIEREPDGGNWRVSFVTGDGTVQSERFAHVVVASGRYNRPVVPEVTGLASFSGAGGIAHTFHYRGAGAYRGKRVLVAGGSISALEIACELAAQGTTVISSQRRQRYVLQKLVGGVPVEHVAFTRFGALAAESFPPEAVLQGLKAFVERTSGNPAQYGAPRPAENIAAAGITLSQSFLPLVAEGRIQVRPWLAAVDGRTVHFADGTHEEVDAILFGTGFELHLPFLSERLRRSLNVDRDGLDLYAHTFHPDLPGLAFLGMYDLVGPNLPVLELQARWLTYVWSGVRRAPSREEMLSGIESYRALRETAAHPPMQALAIRFARLAGAEPDLEHWSRQPSPLTRALLFGPLTPASFRLSGPDALPDAPERVRRDAAAFGAVPDAQLDEAQRAQLRALAAARGDRRLAALADDSAIELRPTGTE